MAGRYAIGNTYGATITEAIVKGCVIMALAMLIVSTENGRNSCSVISASEAEAAEALTAVKSEPHFIGIGTEKAITYMARAWEVCGQHYEALPLQEK